MSSTPFQNKQMSEGREQMEALKKLQTYENDYFQIVLENFLSNFHTSRKVSLKLIHFPEEEIERNEKGLISLSCDPLCRGQYASV